MSLQDFVIYDPQHQTHAYKRPYVGALRDYVAEHENETIAEFFNPKRGVTITNCPHAELAIMQDAYQTITIQTGNHDDLIKTDSEYKKAFGAFATFYHDLRCCAVPESAIQIAFDFDSAAVSWIFDVLDTLYGEDAAYEKFHAPLLSCYAIGWQTFE